MSDDNQTHRNAVVARPGDHPGQVGRFGNITRMVIHPSEEDPTSPNAGTITYPPGTGFPLHKHDFAQVWYILEGTFRIGDREHGPGTMFFHFSAMAMMPMSPDLK